jgi:cyclopropane fatty-acyl-phospholipid synthase-like methyltransferase
MDIWGMEERVETVSDKAGEQYWSSVWKKMDLPDSIDVNNKSLSNHLNIAFHKTFQLLLSGHDLSGKKLLEVGCGNSVWLPYFAKQYGVFPFGLDYSEHGCQQARAILKRENLAGEIYHADMFSPPQHLVEQFDVVVSLGVVEHFTNTSEAIKALKIFLKPRGLLLTSIPNHAGFLGWLQKIINRPVYDIHVILDKEMLVEAIEKTGMKSLKATYLPGCSLYVNMDVVENKPAFSDFKKFLATCAGLKTKAIWMIEKITGRIPPSKWFSPAILSLAVK